MPLLRLPAAASERVPYGRCEAWLGCSHRAAAAAPARLLLLLLPLRGASAACGYANGLTWCYAGAASVSCASTCAANGLTMLSDATAWFNAQNTQAKCQAIANALGSSSSVDIGGYSYACIEVSGGALNGGSFQCSSSSSCPASKQAREDALPAAQLSETLPARAVSAATSIRPAAHARRTSRQVAWTPDS